MFTPDTINALQKTEVLQAVQREISEIPGLYAIPPDFSLSDQEKLLPAKRREANTFSTTSLDAWVEYVATSHANGFADHATTFVNPDTLRAVCVLNHRVGKDSAPGHCDNRANLTLEQSPEHIALKKAAASALTQKQLIEWIEDNMPCITLLREANGYEDAPQEIAHRHAIAALRTITIETARKVETEERNLGASRSAFDSVQAKTRDGQHIPTLMRYTHTPYIGLEPRVYECRIAVLTGGTAPMLSITIRNEAQHMAAMALELQAKIEDATEGVPCYVGELTVGKP